MGKIVKYVHHKVEVCVDEDLKGKHISMCLCHRCDRFTPSNRNTNCHIANELYAICEYWNLVTPVFECPIFIKRTQNGK